MSFERKDVDILGGNTVYTPHILGKSLTAVQFLPVTRFERCRVINFSALCIRREIFEKDQFPEGSLPTRERGSVFIWRMWRKGFGLYVNPEMRQIHKFYTSSFSLAMRMGYDCVAIRKRDPTFPQANWLRATKIFFPFIWFTLGVPLSWQRALKARKVLNIRLYELPVVFLLVIYYRFITMIGILATLSYPSYVRNRLRG